MADLISTHRLKAQAVSSLHQSHMQLHECLIANLGGEMARYEVNAHSSSKLGGLLGTTTNFVLLGYFAGRF